MAQELPTDDLTDRDILIDVQVKLNDVFDRMMRGQFDPEADVIEPLNDLLVYLEEATHPNRPNPVDALVDAALDSLASGVLAASLDDAVAPFVARREALARTKAALTRARDQVFDGIATSADIDDFLTPKTD